LKRSLLFDNSRGWTFELAPYRFNHNAAHDYSQTYKVRILTVIRCGQHTTCCRFILMINIYIYIYVQRPSVNEGMHIRLCLNLNKHQGYWKNRPSQQLFNVFIYIYFAATCFGSVVVR
jgi:hypothetical protein